MEIVASCNRHGRMTHVIGAGVKENTIYVETLPCKGCLEEDSPGVSTENVLLLTRNFLDHPDIEGEPWDGPCECRDCLTA